ncbi:virion morphogenesis protein [Pseudomonas aeruginosa]|uniref:phage head morphogenesis protein n=1 Tax=Pseudomonas aeruginosa TaxID=287 RepID=UPI0005BEAF23|nr:phage minor head protein [Pseudomonas aeruginosa]BAQ37135.1 virion morphogenesis protein [Pseudomonas aeruginosa]
MATPTEADLRAIFAMRPEAAIEYLERKGFAITWNWHDVDAATHARALTVAKAARLDVLQDIRDALVDNLERGGTLRDFQRNLRPVLEAKGWWGRQIVVAPDGGAEVAQLGSPRRLETIYQTNMQSAYMAGRYAAAYEARETHPYWMYVAVMDSVTRPSHAALHGKVFRWDDPDLAAHHAAEWLQLPLPNRSVDGGRCASPWSDGRIQRRQDRSGDRRDGRRQADGGDSGTDPNHPGDDRPGRSEDPISPRCRVRRQPDTERPDGPGAVQQGRAHPGSACRPRRGPGRAPGPGTPARLEGVCGPLHVAQGQTMSVGVLDPTDITYAAAQGAQLQAGVVSASDTVIRNSPVAREQLANLPQRLAQPAMVLWERGSESLVYVVQDGDSTLAVRLRGGVYGPGQMENISQVTEVTMESIDDGLALGRYRRVR